MSPRLPAWQTSTTNSFVKTWYSKGQGKVSDGTSKGVLLEYFRFQLLNGPLGLWILIGVPMSTNLYMDSVMRQEVIIGEGTETSPWVSTNDCRRTCKGDEALCKLYNGLPECWMLFIVNEAGQGIGSDRLPQDYDNLTVAA